MTRVTRLSRYKSFRWLWRKDPEARWFWLRAYVFSRANLQECVMDNLRDFGV